MVEFSIRELQGEHDTNYKNMIGIFADGRYFFLASFFPPSSKHDNKVTEFQIHKLKRNSTNSAVSKEEYELCRREFIQRFGTTPFRVACIKLAQRYGSETAGLTIYPYGSFSRGAKKALHRLEGLGFAEMHFPWFGERLIYVSPETVSMAKK